MWDIHIPNGELDEDLPVPAYGQALTLVDDETDGPVLYSVGGTNGVEFYSDVHRFVFKDRAWSKCYLTGFNNGPEPRYRHELAYWNKKVTFSFSFKCHQYFTEYMRVAILFADFPAWRRNVLLILWFHRAVVL